MEDKQHVQESPSSRSKCEIDAGSMTEANPKNGHHVQIPVGSSPAHAESSGTAQSKKGRACLACRKLKVRCDSIERGLAGCSRCQRLGVECVSAKPLVLALDGEAE